MYSVLIYTTVDYEGPFDSLEEAQQAAADLSGDDTLCVIVDDEGRELDYV